MGRLLIRIRCCAVHAGAVHWMGHVLAGRVVVDGMCGPGTLGLMSVLMGASKVILNDAWRPAIENVLLNLEVK